VTVDLDLHGLLRIRITGAVDDAAVAAVRRQVGKLPEVEATEATGDPDLVVRVVDRLPETGTVRYLGLHEGGFTDDELLVLGSKQRPHARAALPFGAGAGDGPRELRVERGFRAVPLLIAFLNLAALAKDVLPLHASAFVHEGRGIVVTGWSKGGKTEALLAFLSVGATYVGDEWLYLPADGRTVHGIPQPVTVWDWQIRQLPDVAAALTRAERVRLGLIRTGRTLDRFAPVSGPGYSGDTSLPAEVLGGMLPMLARRSHVNVPPERLPGGRPMATSASFDRLFLVASEEPEAVTVDPVDPLEVAERMAASLHFERGPLLEWYDRYRFAFPGRRDAAIDGAADAEGRLLRSVFEGKPAWVARHPYPVELARLRDAMAPYC
jgi:hypothetical protein